MTVSNALVFIIEGEARLGSRDDVRTNLTSNTQHPTFNVQLALSELNIWALGVERSAFASAVQWQGGNSNS